MLPRLMIVVVTVVAAAAVVLAVPVDEIESRQAGGAAAEGAGEKGPPGSNFTITGEDLDKIVEEIKDQLGFEDSGFPVPTHSITATVGNILYSTAGFVLGGLLLFVSLFDETRKPVIAFFDVVFGSRQSRRRRDATQGLEARVEAAFQAFTAAVDKMNAVLRVANAYK